MSSHQHRCWGRTRNLQRCGRIGDWRLFCDEHRFQPLGWLFVLVFTVVGGFASIQSAWFPHFWNMRGSAATAQIATLNTAQPPPDSATEEPVIHIEPENAMTWSTTSELPQGVYEMQIYSTSHAIDHVSIEQSFFVAENNQSDFIFKNLGGLAPVYKHEGVLRRGEKYAFQCDFRPYSKIAKAVQIGFSGPSLFGVKVLVKYWRHVDGLKFTKWKGYASINPTAPAIYDSDSKWDEEAKESPPGCPGVVFFNDGKNYYTDSLNADDAAVWSNPHIPPCGKPIKANFPISPKGLLRLKDLEFYMNLSGHWVPVTHEVPADKYY